MTLKILSTHFLRHFLGLFFSSHSTSRHSPLVIVLKSGPFEKEDLI